MIPSHDQRRPHPISASGTRPYFPKTIYILLLLAFVITGLGAVPTLRRTRSHLAVLRNLIEAAAAPGEPVLVDNLLLYRFLCWKGSPALREQLLLEPNGRDAQSPIANTREMLVVSTANSTLVNTLRVHGYALIPDTAQLPWIASGYTVAIPRRGQVVIQFAVPPPPPLTSSQQPQDGTR